MIDNIPPDATLVTFHYGKKRGEFYVWQTKGGKFQWSALGNCGEELTQADAIAVARKWIQFGTTD